MKQTVSRPQGSAHGAADHDYANLLRDVIWFVPQK
jgi:hypothetical protein